MTKHYRCRSDFNQIEYIIYRSLSRETIAKLDTNANETNRTYIILILQGFVLFHLFGGGVGGISFYATIIR